MRVEVSGLDRFAAELASRPAPFANPSVEAKPWGRREMVLTDPFGNRLVFWEALDA